ncbi:MAG: hypothetical protein K0S99_135 [Thermomicrobiales bacterium]|jgi:hypothetical protein|nr:hypothetical protein [Thermomicrobiales bacterium]
MPPTFDPLKWAVTSFRDTIQAQRYDLYDRYVSGVHQLAFATPKFESTFGATFAAFAYNRCGSVVDAHTDRLQVAGFGADSDALSQQAQDLWDGNQLDVREGEVEAEAMGIGDGYVIVETDPLTGRINVWPNEARHIRVRYSTERPGQRELAAKAWKIDDDYLRLNLYWPNRIEKYITRNRAPSGMPTTPNAFEQYTEDGEQSWSIPLAVPDTVPVFHFGNNARTGQYGRSELRDVIPLQNALNQTYINMLLANEFAAFPQKVITDADMSDPLSEVSLQRVQAGIDRIMLLFSRPGEDKTPTFGEFAAADIAKYITVADFIDKCVARVSKVPVHYLEMSGGFPSGRALRTAEAPFVAKIVDRQRAFGWTWSEAVSYGLRLQGQPVEPGKLRTNWEPAAPMSEEDKWDLAEVKLRAGMPFEAIIREMGYETDQVKMILAEKSRETEAALRMVSTFESPDEGEGEDEEAA